MLILCELCGQEDATMIATWGLYEPNGKPRVEPMNEAALGPVCSEALWSACKGAVNAGLMHWSNKEVPCSP